MRTIGFIICMFIGLAIGGVLVAWIFFGLLTLSGLIGLIENIAPLKWIVYRTSAFWDIIIFLATIIATAKLGVTITASLSVAGLGFTFVYRPWIQAQRAKDKAAQLDKQFKHRL